MDRTSIKSRPCDTNKRSQQSTFESHCIAIYYEIPPKRAKNVCIYITIYNRAVHKQKQHILQLPHQQKGMTGG